MASKTSVAVVSPSQTPYQLNPEQTLKASKALLNHIRKETKRIRESTSKKNLLADNDDSASDEEDVVGDEIPIWLNLTTKQHIVDRNRLIPSKISVPHSLHASETLNICVITADPQRSLKNTVADPAFPAALSSKITKIIGFTKLKDRYKTFEQRRALLNEHDIFLADDRIITRLPAVLGKVFYKGTSKRPIAISIAEQLRVDGKRVKAAREERKTKPGSAPTASPAVVAKEIEKAVSAVPVNLRPGTTVAIRVGLASFTPEQVADNATVVVSSVIDKHVVKGWRNVKAVHIKSPDSMALPIWLADELWAEDENVEEVADKAAIETESEEGLKRKRNPATTKGPQVGSRKKSKMDEAQAGQEASERERNVMRKEKLLAQKQRAFKETAISA